MTVDRQQFIALIGQSGYGWADYCMEVPPAIAPELSAERQSLFEKLTKRDGVIAAVVKHAPMGGPIEPVRGERFTARTARRMEDSYGQNEGLALIVEHEIEGRWKSSFCWRRPSNPDQRAEQLDRAECYRHALHILCENLPTRYLK